MEKDINDVKKIIQYLYQEIDGDPEKIIRVGMVNDNYQVFKIGGKQATVVREWIEDFMDSNDSLSKSKIKNSLKSL